MDRRVFVLGTAAMLIAPSAAAGERRTATLDDRPLICTASIRPTTIEFDSEFELTALIEWTKGDGRIFLPLSWGYRGFQVSISSAAAKVSNPPINDFHPPPPQAVNDPSWFVHMSQGMIIGQKITPRARTFFPERGEFTVFVDYLSPVPQAFTKVAKAVVTEDGMFSASPLRVVVT